MAIDLLAGTKKQSDYSKALLLALLSGKPAYSGGEAMARALTGGVLGLNERFDKDRELSDLNIAVGAASPQSGAMPPAMPPAPSQPSAPPHMAAPPEAQPFQPQQLSKQLLMNYARKNNLGGVNDMPGGTALAQASPEDMPPGSPLPTDVPLPRPRPTPQELASSLHPQINDIKGAVSKIESGGFKDPYNAMGPRVVTGGAPDQAHGKYQVMGNNVGPWTEQILSRRLTPEQFRNDPDAQETVAGARLTEYANKYGPEGAARAWFAGERGMNNPNARARDPNGNPIGINVAEYGNKFNAGMPQPAPTPVSQPDATLPPGAGPIEGRAPTQFAQAQVPNSRIEFLKRYSENPNVSTEGRINAKRMMLQELIKSPDWDIKTLDDGTKIYTNKNNPTQGGVIMPDEALGRARADQKGREAAATEREKKRIELEYAGPLKSATEFGEVQGKARAALPKVESDTDAAIATIQQIREHPGKNWGVGTFGNIWSAVPGSREAGFADLVDQANGRIFAQAFESIKGGGAITEKEGEKAAAALTRVKQARNMKDFDEAVSDLEREFVRLRDITRRRAGVQVEERQQQQQNGGPVSVTSPEEARRLPKGTKILLPDGTVGVVP